MMESISATAPETPERIGGQLVTLISGNRVISPSALN
jgi:hypothetical protein